MRETTTTAQRPGTIPSPRAAADPVAPDTDMFSMISMVLGLHTQERRWNELADGQWCTCGGTQDVAETGWEVVHAPPTSRLGTGIDHLIAGPGGVIAMRSKHLPGSAVWVTGSVVLHDGHPKAWMRRARHDATRMQRQLRVRAGIDVPVSWLIQVSGADVIMREQPRGGAVLDATGIPAYLRSLPERIDPGVVQEVTIAARRSATWH